MTALVSRLNFDPYIASIVGMVALAAVLPAEGSGMAVAGEAGSAMIAAMFFLQGVRLAPQAGLAGARHWRLHAVVLASTFLLFPMLGLAARALAPGLLTPPLWTGDC
jgi:solute carrier family 10 (sodium/bile acid cotransporter), member 7